MPRTSPPLSSTLPPLICGTATFNDQYNADPQALPTTAIVHRAFASGLRAFDSSPYYGPSEQLLGQALDTPFIEENFPRKDYMVLTKVGRIKETEFDYSPEWVRESVGNSLGKLRTRYLDLVYCHDVEFVTPPEVLAAVKELRQIRDETGVVKYIGISGYPVNTLCEIAEMILRETGEPLDAVMSYANYTVQNTRLATEGVARLQAAGVDVVLNASLLGMGLLRRQGVPIGGQGDFHPASQDLRAAVRQATDVSDRHNEKLESVALRYALESWLSAGSAVGSKGKLNFGAPLEEGRADAAPDRKLGVSVIGVSSTEELEETLQVWASILDGIEDSISAKERPNDYEKSVQMQEKVQSLVKEIRESLGEWVDSTWSSPPAGFKNTRGN
ncbi:Aldo/keto reductase [Xylona heveae TC161]|uniref:Aldo/keto reductase n=1 Tax=Xylona heveae (strain CBS 132557 / TC161) TaxID=1328760 RepID=A0A165H1X3_XYLHT|nr:Aldo/keto reductase [Xylona heveae TC161]KZF22878.1 Aldo/keto reductase [Xylona heveae TC161]